MPIPKFLPDIEPTIPSGYKFIAVTRLDPTEPVAIMGWPTTRIDSEGNSYQWDVTPERVTERCQQEGLQMVSWREVNYNEIPKDRTYRNAWEDQAGALVHNLEKAKDIHRDHLRVARIEKLEALDVEYQRADEQGDTAAKAAIAAQKQILRDLPAAPEITNAQTITELKEFWPLDSKG